MSINMDNYINDKNMQKETLLTEINILKNERKEIDEKTKSKEQEVTCPHQPRYDVSQIPSKYSTPEWRAKRAAILKRDNYKCQMCGDSATQVHHINYREENWFYNVGDKVWRSPDSHLVSLCSTCHKKFKGTRCDDAIFIPGNPPRLASSERKCKRTDLELVNPNWDDVYEELRYISLDKDYNQEKALLLTVLNPESTILGREVLGLQKKNGINELDKYKLIHRFRKEDDIRQFGLRLLQLQAKHPSIQKNCMFITSKIESLLEDCRKRPSKGIIHMAQKRKKDGCAIGIFDIEKNAFVRIFDMSNVPEYRNTPKNGHKFLSQFYALKYVSDRCKETGENSYDIPIFPNDPNGDLSYVNNETVKAEVESRIEDKNICKLVNEKMKEMDFSNFYLYEGRWDKELWGEIPTAKYRNKSLLKIKKENGL